jgi:hypothetical protein
VVSSPLLVASQMKEIIDAKTKDTKKNKTT